ncbi:MAG: hypothetical protein GY696_24865 [Gammaproteobacteria bacterium]|nr:hypothetical protein [Gammaproteobacteria bacterium]
MKQILAPFILLCSMPLGAEIGILDSKPFDQAMLGQNGPVHVLPESAAITTLCIDGYKYVYSYRESSQGMAMVLIQSFEVQNNTSLPARCR